MTKCRGERLKNKAGHKAYLTIEEFEQEVRAYADEQGNRLAKNLRKNWERQETENALLKERGRERDGRYRIHVDHHEESEIKVSFDATGCLSPDGLKSTIHAYIDAQAEILVLRERARRNVVESLLPSELHA